MKKILFLGLAILLLPSLVLAADYNQSCIPEIGGNNTICNVGGACLSFPYVEDCPECFISTTCGHSCPEISIENSHFVDDNCLVHRPCSCQNYLCLNMSGSGCDLLSGTCNYACDTGYHYESGSCLLDPILPTFFAIDSSDITAMLAYVGGLFSDAKLLILMVIGVPLAFYVIPRVIKLAPADKEEKEYQKVSKMTEKKDAKGLEKWLKRYNKRGSWW